MAVLLSCQNLSKTYGASPLFEDVSLTINEGDRLGLIGPNGSGKSTLLQILGGLKEPDTGVSASRKLTRLGYVAQESSFPGGKTVKAVLRESLDGEQIDELEKSARISEAIGKAGFTGGDEMAESLSGGWGKRLSIASQLIRKPDIMLLDEPTNHLDLEGILWLEKLLKPAPFASIVVSHDRYFLENVATDMAELNRVYPGGLFRVKGNYSEFLAKKEEFLTAQAKQQESLANKVHRELEWLRRGPKARTSKSKARIESAGRMMDELAEMAARGRTSSAQIDFSASGRKTKKLVEAEGVEKRMGDRTLFRNLKLVLSPGTRVGLVGLNGSGKTTLLRLIRGELEPDAGRIEKADGLRVVYFDQNREQLDPQMPLRRALAPHGDSVIYRERVIHLAAWSRRFLFRPEQLDLPVERLSGGEKARVLIARLMLVEADLLLLDEPTNDLDIPTLEVLEESLMEFPGALVLVTHDRYMLDRVSTRVLGLDGEGGAQLYADYSQWEQDQFGRKSRVPAPASPDKREAEARLSTAQGKKRLSYLESREWESMEARILQAEAELEQKKARIQDPDVVTDPILLQRSYEEMLEVQNAVDELYARWSELEAKLS